jgi:hypothetical protein
MPVAAKLLAFGVGLAAVFGATLAVGSQVGPVGETAAAEQLTDHGDGQVTGHESSSDGVHDNGGADNGGAGGGGLDDGSVGSDVPGGLQVSEGGYTFVLASPVLPAGTGTVEFVIEGPDGSAVTEYEIEHEKELHLIAVRRDFTGFQHVHPERASDGTWAATLDLTGGTWRLFADFTPVAEDGAGGEGLTLGADVTVTGPTSRVAAASPEVRRVDTVDGYRVELAGDLTPGEESNLAFAVTRQGDPVADLQPYLGARGHLVALREGDLAYLHVHPTDDEDATGNEVGFAATVPSVGGYRLYLDFRVDGVVRTASFVLRTDNRRAGESSAADDEDSGGETHGEDDHGH